MLVSCVPSNTIVETLNLQIFFEIIETMHVHLSLQQLCCIFSLDYSRNCILMFIYSEECAKVTENRSGYYRIYAQFVLVCLQTFYIYLVII